MSYTRNFQHIVFRTKCSELTIPEDQKRILLTFLFEYCKRARVYLRRVNTYRNHVHMLVDLPPSMPISEFVRGVKSRSSAELSHSRVFPYFNGWAVGYASFSVSYYEVEKITNYIKNQEEHHQSTSFEEEFLSLLRVNGVTEDEYVFKD